MLTALYAPLKKWFAAQERTAVPGVTLAICLLLLGVIVSQITLMPYPVTNDGASHIYNAALTRALLVGDSSWTSAVALNSRAVPNWGIPALIMAAGGGVAAAKLVMVLSLVTLFAAFVYCARSWSPLPSWSPIGLVLADWWFLWMGFWGFCLATAVALLEIGWIRRRWDSPKVLYVVPVVLLQTLVLLFHPIPALFVAALISIMWLSELAQTELANKRLPLLGAAFTGVLLLALSPPIARGYGVPWHAENLRTVIQSLIVFPMDALETVRLPHANMHLAVGAMLLAVILAAITPARRLSGTRSLAIASIGLLVGRLVLHDAQGGGAFVNARLGALSLILLAIWALPRLERQTSSAVSAVIMLSCAIGIPLQTYVARQAGHVVAHVVEAGREAQPVPGETIVRVRSGSPIADSAFSLRRLRLPYLLTHSVDWLAEERRLQHVTNYELLGLNFTTRLRSEAYQPTTQEALRKLEEPRQGGLGSSIEFVLRSAKPDLFVLIGEDTADLPVLRNAGYRVVSARGSPPFVRYLRQQVAGSQNQRGQRPTTPND